MGCYPACRAVLALGSLGAQRCQSFDEAGFDDAIVSCRGIENEVRLGQVTPLRQLVEVAGTGRGAAAALARRTIQKKPHTAVIA